MGNEDKVSWRGQCYHCIIKWTIKFYAYHSMPTTNPNPNPNETGLWFERKIKKMNMASLSLSAFCLCVFSLFVITQKFAAFWVITVFLSASIGPALISRRKVVDTHGGRGIWSLHGRKMTLVKAGRLVIERQEELTVLKQRPRAHCVPCLLWSHSSFWKVTVWTTISGDCFEFKFVCEWMK